MDKTGGSDMAKFLDPEAALRLLALASKGGAQPKAIRDLKAKIETATNLATKWTIKHGAADPEQILRITQMKLELDALYARWAEGKIT